jgi:hypothetical protein
MRPMDVAALIRDCASGEGSVLDLASVGIRVEGETPQLAISIPSGIPEVLVSPAEVSRGLLAAWARGTDLAEWAFVTRALVTLEGEDSPVWETLMGALWSAAFGEPIPDETLTLARSLAG